MFPITFAEKASPTTLEDSLPQLQPDTFRKVRVLSEAINGKVRLAEGKAPGLPAMIVVKEMRKTCQGKGLECPRNELFAALEIGRLRLPHIAEVLCTAQDEKYFYLVIEHCYHGELLSVVQSQGRQGDDWIREVISEILVGVESLHAQGIAHRDLSLENILVTEDGDLRIIDFAQAIMVHPPNEPEKEARVSQLHGPPGKQQYRAPELAGAGDYLATKVDMFAVGVILYVLATGMYPNLTRNVKASAAVQLPKNCAVSEGLLDLIRQLLNPDANERTSAKEALRHPWLTESWPTGGASEASADVSTDCCSTNGDLDLGTEDSDGAQCMMDAN